MALATLLLAVDPAWAEDVPPGPIAQDTTWTAANSPYRVAGDITLQSGFTLTIEPGVEVIFSRYARLNVEGTLHAVGNAQQPVVLTGSTEEAGFWGGIFITGTSDQPNLGAKLEHVQLEFAGSAQSIYLEHADATLEHCSISYSNGNGIYGDTSGSANISDTSFSSNAGMAVVFDDGSVDPVLADLTASGNGFDGVALGDGVLQGSHLWENTGVSYLVTGDITVDLGAQLTIEPGVNVLFGRYVRLFVQGTLLSAATELAPIAFSGSGEETGWWGGIHVTGTSEQPNRGTRFEHVSIEFGGSVQALYLEHAEVALDNCHIAYAAGDGISAGDGGTAHITASTFVGNTGDAVRFVNGSANPVLLDLAASGNGFDGVAVGPGTLAGAHLWERSGIPYRVLGSVVVGADATLTIDPGVTIYFERYASLVADGTLIADGTSTEPIVLTARTQESGLWSGLTVKGTIAHANTTSVLNNLVVERAHTNLTLEYADIALTDSTFSAAEYYGLRTGEGVSLTVLRTSFHDNGDRAIWMEDISNDPRFVSLSAEGNGTDAIVLSGGTVDGDVLWENVGIPYVVLFEAVVNRDATLTIEPGIEVQFGRYAGITANGGLRALGTELAPILLTGTSTEPGLWRGVTIQGTVAHANVDSELHHTHIEYGGGSGANVRLRYARSRISDCRIRHSVARGIDAEHAGGTIIEHSHIVDNGAASDGLYNGVGGRIFAVNNWWGHASGPGHDPCNLVGEASVVRGDVLFAPFWTTPEGGEADVISPTGTATIEVRPQRWFAPADDHTRIWVKLRLVAAEGQPLSGRTLRLESTLGDVVDGGVTDVAGETLAYLTSTQIGEATLTATSEQSTQCEPVLSEESLATFTDAEIDEALFEDLSAPYMNGSIHIEPLPVAAGVATTVSATLVNRDDVPITVSGIFEIAQFGLGLLFGPIGEFEDFEIPAGEERTVEVQWTPPVSGHICIQLQHAYGPSGSSGGQQTAGSSQRNLNVGPGKLGSAGEHAQISRAREGVGWLQNGLSVVGLASSPSGFAADQIGFGIPNSGVGAILDFNFNAWGTAIAALGGDPPRQDYRRFARTDAIPFTPVDSSEQLSETRAQAANEMLRTFLDLTSELRAANLSFDRYGGASEAGNLFWASQQAKAFLYFKGLAGQRMQEAADRIDAYVGVLRAEGIEDLIAETDTIVAYQARLRSDGFTAGELEAAQLVGLTDSEIAASLQQHIDAVPGELAGSAVGKLLRVAEDFRELGSLLRVADNFPNEQPSPGRDVGQAANELVRLGDYTTAVPVGNPLAHAATIELRARRIGLPLSWDVQVHPTAIDLDAGQQAAVDVRIRANGPAPQGSRPRVAVEGYADGVLIGGVVQEIMVPIHVPVAATACDPTAAKEEGEECECDFECDDGMVCADPSGSGKVCLTVCRDAVVENCPTGDYTCLAWAESGDGLCIPADNEEEELDPEPGDGDGGCQCAAASANRAEMLMLFALWPMFWLARTGQRRRRQSGDLHKLPR